MPTIVVIAAFWIFLASCVATLWLNGGRDGRRMAMAISGATFATFAVGRLLGIEAAPPYVLGIDAALLLFGILLALTSDRHWPLWFCGFHLIAVAAGIAHFAFPAELAANYIDTAGFWALPALGFAALGALIDNRLLGGGFGLPESPVHPE